MEGLKQERRQRKKGEKRGEREKGGEGKELVQCEVVRYARGRSQISRNQNVR